MECSGAVTGFGGSAANTAFWLARLGLPVTLAGSVGKDPFGDTHLKNLEEAGVLVSEVQQVDQPSGLALVISLGRAKRMIRIPGANMYGEVNPGLVEECRLLFLSGIHLPTLIGYAREAAGRNVPVVCGWHGARESDVVRLTNGFILNADEAEDITGLEDPEESITALDTEFAAVTLPKGGCVVSRGIDVHTVTAAELEPVDRTGGGDAFAAGFMAGLYHGKDIIDCGLLGNRLAAAVIMGMGARPEISIPSELKT
jgi:ribokinase